MSRSVCWVRFVATMCPTAEMSWAIVGFTTRRPAALSCPSSARHSSAVTGPVAHRGVGAFGEQRRVFAVERPLNRASAR